MKAVIKPPSVALDTISYALKPFGPRVVVSGTAAEGFFSKDF